MRIKILCPVITLLLTACGGGGAGNESPIAAAANVIAIPDTVRYFAEIRQSNLTSDDDAEVSTMLAVFTEFPNLALTDVIKKTHTSDPGCEIKRQTVEEIAAEQALLNSQYAIAVVSNAGESITVTTPNSTWPELKKIGSYGAAYSADWGVELGLLPAGSTMDVPGDEFPAVSKIELPYTEALTGVEYSIKPTQPLLITEAVTPSVMVSWDAPDASLSRVKLSLLNDEYDDAGKLVSVSTLICDIEDNGAFSIPEDTKLLMDPQYEFRSLVRFNVITEKRGDALIYAYSESRSLAIQK